MMASLSTEEDEAPPPEYSISIDSAQPPPGSQAEDDDDAAAEAVAAAKVAASPPVVYQIHHSSTNIGRRASMEGIKRIVSFRYGILVAGRRTEEHEIVLTWSIRTGKRHITLDGKRAYYIQIKGFGVCDHTIATPDGRSVRVLACTSPPTRSSDDFKTYECIIDGISFFDLPTRAGDGSIVPGTDRASVTRTGLTTVGEVLCPEVYAAREEAKEIETQNSSPRSATHVLA